MKNKYFGDSLDYFEKNTTNEKYISGNNLELLKANDILSARTINRPTRQILEDSENSYQIIQNMLKTLYGQTKDETKEDVKIIPDIYEEMNEKAIAVGRFNTDTEDWYLRIPTGAFIAKLPDKLANVYKYTFDEDNQYSRDFYISDDRDSAIIFNRPNIELFERQLASHFNINLNDQNNDIRVFVENYTDTISDINAETESDQIKKSANLSKRIQKIRYYAEIDNTTYDYKNGITVGVNTTRIPINGSYCNNIFQLTNSIFEHYKNYLTNTDSYYSLEEVINISDCSSGDYSIYYNPTLETNNSYLYSKTNRFVIIKDSDLNNLDNLIKLFSFSLSRQEDTVDNDNRFIIRDQKAYFKKIDRTKLTIKNIELTNTINKIVFENVNKNYNISNSHLLENENGTQNISIGENTLGYPQINNVDKNPELYSQAFKTNIGNSNIAIGAEAMRNTANPVGNIAIGSGTLKNVNSGQNNIEIGIGNKRTKNDTEFINIGSNLQQPISTLIQPGNKNIIIGRNNLDNIKTFSGSNIVFGINNDIRSITGDGNTIIGRENKTKIENNIESSFGTNNTIIGINNEVNSSVSIGNNIMLFGNNNIFSSTGENNHIFGNSNTIKKDSNKSLNTYLVGQNNILSGGDSNYITGELNKIEKDDNKNNNSNFIFGNANTAKNSTNTYLIGLGNKDADGKNNYSIGSYIENTNQVDSIKIGGYSTNKIYNQVVETTNCTNIGPINGIYIEDNDTTSWAIQASAKKYTINYTGSLPVFKPNFVVNAGVIQINNKYLELKQLGTINYGWTETLGGRLVETANYKTIVGSTLQTGISPGVNTYGNGISISSSIKDKNKTGSIFKQDDSTFNISTHSVTDSYCDVILSQYRFSINEQDKSTKITLLSKDGTYSSFYNIYPNSTNTYILGNTDKTWEDIFTRNIHLRISNGYAELNKDSTTETHQFYGVLNLSNVGDLKYNVNSVKNELLLSADTLRYWNGSYQTNTSQSKNASNLRYCSNGEILGTYGNQTISYSNGTKLILTKTGYDTTKNDAKSIKLQVHTSGDTSVSAGMIVAYGIDTTVEGNGVNGNLGVNAIYSHGNIYSKGAIATESTLNVRGVTNLNGNVTINGDVRGKSFTATSARKYKKDIIPTKHNAIDEINKINIVDFFFKTDENNENPKVGFVADDTDSIFSTPKKDAMDLYNCVGMLLKAVQELSNENKKLKEEIDSLKS